MHSTPLERTLTRVAARPLLVVFPEDVLDPQPLLLTASQRVPIIRSLAEPILRRAGRLRERGRPRRETAAMTFLATVLVTIVTTLGSIHVALDDERAPKTVANFLWYVHHGAFDGGRFHRTVTTHPDNQPHNRVKIDVIQATNAPGWDKRLRPPVAFEPTSRTGIHHRDGTISMARDPGLDTAQTDFFICIGDRRRETVGRPSRIRGIRPRYERHGRRPRDSRRARRRSDARPADRDRSRIVENPDGVRHSGALGSRRRIPLVTST